MARREVLEGQQKQGADEKIPYRVTTTPWGSSPSSVVVKCFDITSTRTDVTATNLSGSASVDGDVITCPILQTLTAGNTYRVDVLFVAGGVTFEPFFIVQAEY